MVVDHFGDRFDWTTFRDRARAWGAERSVLATFGLTERLLGWRRPATVPPDLALPSGEFDVVGLSERLMFEESGRLAPNVNVVRLWGDASPVEKARLLLKRIFLPRAEMGFYFGLPADSPRLLFLYPLRAWQLLTRYSVTVTRALRKDSSTIAAFDVGEQRNRLVDWLGGA